MQLIKTLLPLMASTSLVAGAAIEIRAQTAAQMVVNINKLTSMSEQLQPIASNMQTGDTAIAKRQGNPTVTTGAVDLAKRQGHPTVNIGAISKRQGNPTINVGAIDLPKRQGNPTANVGATDLGKRQVNPTLNTGATAISPREENPFQVSFRSQERPRRNTNQMISASDPRIREYHRYRNEPTGKSPCF